MAGYQDTPQEQAQWHTLRAESRKAAIAQLEGVVDGIYPPKQYEFLNSEAKLRINAVIKYYEFYELSGQFWEPDTMDYVPTVAPVNHVRKLIDKQVAFEFEDTPTLEAISKVVDSPEDMEKDDYEPSDEQSAAKARALARTELIRTVWGDNAMETELLAGGKDRRIGGLVAIKIAYSSRKGIRLHFRPAHEVFPYTDPEDMTDLETIHFCSFLDNDKTLWKQTYRMRDGWCYLTEGTYTPTLEPIEIVYEDEPLGLDFIPVVLVPNKVLSNMLFGYSSLADLIPLADVYNRRFSDYADALRFNMQAIAVIQNAGPGVLKELKLAPGEFWSINSPLDKDASAYYLESSFSFSDALNEFLTRLERLMYELANVPQLDPEKITGLGVPSGVALKMLHAALVSETNQSWRTWKRKLELVNEYVLRTLDAYRGSEGFPDDRYEPELTEQIAGEYKTEVAFHLPLPESEMDKLDYLIKEMAWSLEGVKGAMAEKGEPYPARKLAEILAEREMMDTAGAGPYGKEIDVKEGKSLHGK